MKTLSIQQPWASLICAGIKDVENRTWKAAQIPGRILIHASSKKVTKNFYASIPEEMESYISNHVFYGNIAPLTELPTSAIIGYVTVKSFEEKYTGSVWDGGPEAIKWKLEDAWMFDEPILNVKGKLNLFDYDLDEDNLPPAHQVDLAEVNLEDGDLVIPTTDSWVDDYAAGKFEGANVYVTDDNIDILCTQGDTVSLRPIKRIIMDGKTKMVSFEADSRSGVFSIPDLDDETKPYMIDYHDGTNGPWLLADFVFGKKLDEGETVSVCGGVTFDL